MLLVAAFLPTEAHSFRGFQGSVSQLLFLPGGRNQEGRNFVPGME
jgi:hypothetical protein